jgi:hypothetical protein
MSDVITQKRLKELFTYEDGALYWKCNRNSTVFAGDKAGSEEDRGYTRIGVDGKLYRLHRLIYLFHYGEHPKIVDHIDCDVRNNRIENLRAVNSAQSAQNTKFRGGSSGIKNVFKNGNLWTVRMNVAGKFKYFGAFKDIELAELVAIEARNKFHGKYANHG